MTEHYNAPDRLGNRSDGTKSSQHTIAGARGRNDQVRMTKQIRMTKPQWGAGKFTPLAGIALAACPCLREADSELRCGELRSCWMYAVCYFEIWVWFIVIYLGF